MCGIAGAFGSLYGVDSEGIAKRVIQEIHYRGPDGDGIAHFENGFFVHVRLSVIDTTSGGTQPKWSANNRFCIAYNGEIYNYRELKAELAAQGHIFATESDTEVLLKVWETGGAEGLRRCIGMYAFALFDAERHEVYFARDAYGIKPLYIAQTETGVRFGSTYAALSCFPDCPRRANAGRAFEFVRYGILDMYDTTLVEGVRPLEPGAVETWDVSGGSARFVGKKIVVRPSIGVRSESRSFDQAAEELREAFLLSVRLHMRSDVPIGFALSGGIDSSAIVCAARLLEPDADLRTFTYSAEGGTVDESGWAKLVSDHTRATAHVVRLSSATSVGALGDVVRTHGTPTASMSTQAQMAVFSAAHDAGIKVMLDGQGADELFAGYTGYIGSALAGYLRRGEYGDAMRTYHAAMRVPRIEAWRIGAWTLEHMLRPEWKQCLRRLARLEHLPEWIDKTWVESQTGRPVGSLGPTTENFGSDVLGERLAYDLKELIIPGLLIYEDRNSMRYSVESRVPFLSAPVTDVAHSVPSSYHLGCDAVTKRLLRASLRGILPEEIRTRADKVGFEVPQETWLANEHQQIDKLLQSDIARSIKLFDYSKLMARWRAIDRPRHPDFKYVWRWVGLVVWSQTFGIEWN